MKLIRLVSEDPNCIFDNSFNENLIIEKDSKIALKSISVDTVTNLLDVDASNNEIEYEISTGKTKTIQLEHATYGRINYEDLFTDMALKFNNNSGFVFAPDPLEDRREIGIEWNVSINQANKTSIRYEHGPNDEHLNNWTYDNTLVQRLTSNNRQVWRQIGATSDTGNERCGIFKSYVAKGCGIVRCRTNKFTIQPGPTTPEENGYIIGFSTVNISAKSPKDLITTDLTYGVAVCNNNAGTRQYYTVRDGVYTLSGTSPNYIAESNINNDYQEVIKNFQTIQINIYKNGSAIPTKIFEEAFPSSDVKLYPFFVFRGPNADLNNLRTTPSPFANAAFGFTSVVSDLTQETLHAPPVPQRNPSQNYIDMSLSLSQFLGYDTPRIPQAGYLTVVAADYIGDVRFDPIDVADAFMVEMLNIKLDSYDGYLNQRKNILAVIPESDKEGEVLFYSNNPTFINLNNPDDLLLRNIRCRIIKPDYSPIYIRGEASLVLLIDKNK